MSRSKAVAATAKATAAAVAKAEEAVRANAMAAMPEVWVENVPEDHNTDVCGICARGGDLLCCDFCPRAFHLECIGVVEEDLPEGDWRCQGCTADDKQWETEPLLQFPEKSSGLNPSNDQHGASSPFASLPPPVTCTSRCEMHRTARF